MKSSMLKGVLLIFDSARTWELIALKPPRWLSVLVIHLLPLLMITSLVEGYGLVKWGKPQGQIQQIRNFGIQESIGFEAAQSILTLALIVISAKFIKSLGETFHGRHTFMKTFVLVAYCISPVIMFRCLNAIPPLSPWIPWGIGMFLAIAALYNGLPKIMDPDPPHAFGLFLASSMLLLIAFGFLRFLTYWYLAGHMEVFQRLFHHA